MSVPYITHIGENKNNIYDTDDIMNIHLRIILLFNYWFKRTRSKRKQEK